jgi:glycosyltransferase involved in cell wall biosynthesis
MTSQQEMNTTGLSVVLGTYNRKPFLKLAVESIRRELANAAFPHEIIVVDGGSTDGTLRWLTKQKDIITIVQHNRGIWQGKEIERRSWGYFMNLGFREAQGKYICMLSDDCLVIPSAIVTGYRTVEQESLHDPPVGVVCFYFRDWPEYLDYGIYVAPNDVLLLNHGIFSKKALEDVGYIDEDNYLFYYADSDLCLRIWEKGYRIIESSDSYIEHYSHANVFVRRINATTMDCDWKIFYYRWKSLLGLEFETKKDICMRREKDYQDPNATLAKFRWLHRMNSWYFCVRKLYRMIQGPC